MTIAICDDDTVFRNMLYSIIEKSLIYYDADCIQYADGSDLLSAYENGEQFDVIFLDIEMETLDGITTARKIREYSSDVIVIFLTSHTDMACEGYEVNAFRFLTKPVNKEQITKVLNQIYTSLYSGRRISFYKDGYEHIVSAENILYAESDNNMVRFILTDDEYSMRIRISDALQMLNSAVSIFTRVHRCTVVNLKHVLRYSRKEVVMKNGTAISISRSYADEFKNKMFLFIKQNAV